MANHFTEIKPLTPNDFPNPFQKWLAEQEPRLEEFFVQGPHYHDLFGGLEQLGTVSRRVARRGCVSGIVESIRAHAHSRGRNDCVHLQRVR